MAADLDALIARYTPGPVPPCPVCGRQLEPVTTAPFSGVIVYQCPHHVTTWPQWIHDPAVVAACAELAQLRVQQAALVEALKQFGWHNAVCARRWTLEQPCDCGLDAALAAAKGEQP
jgi:hypothetical protein